MKLTLGYSPCPNDCFIFDALVHNKINTHGIDVEVVLEDVETLNRMAQQARLDVTKLSFHAYAHVIRNYILLRAGSALGFNCGPLLVAKNAQALATKAKSDWKIAIPGRLTTANFLLSLAFPEVKQRREYVFSEIEEAVLNEEVDAGLIIHENRFTYAQKGLEKVLDLGEYWDSRIHAPIPLGGIAIRRSLPTNTQQLVNKLIKESVEFAFVNPQSSMPYVKAHAQAMSETVMQQHIALYVNKFSVDLGKEGEDAVRRMFNTAIELKLFDYAGEKLMID